MELRVNNQFHFNMDDLTFQLFHYMFYSITKNQTCSFLDTSCIHGAIACQKNGLLVFKIKLTNKCPNVQPTFTTYFNTFIN